MKINSNKIKLILAKKQLTYKELSNMTGLSKTTLTNLSKGSCSHITIGKLAKALEVPVQDLIED